MRGCSLVWVEGDGECGMCEGRVAHNKRTLVAVIRSEETVQLNVLVAAVPHPPLRSSPSLARSDLVAEEHTITIR